MSRYLGSKMILEENWELYRRCWSSEENRVDDHGDDKEGWIGVVGAPDGPWRRWPTAVVVEEEPFLFFIDSAIWRIFCRFQLVESKEEWKRWSIGFVGHDLDLKWVFFFEVGRGIGYLRLFWNSQRGSHNVLTSMIDFCCMVGFLAWLFG